MKNIVLLIVDSMNYSHVKKHPELTPFLNELMRENYYFLNMFSQAPYTEAAVMNVYCGQNVLDNGGYLKRFKYAKKTIFEAMREKGYETYYNSFQPQCYPSTLRRGIDCIFNNVGYDLDALWSYRLYHYSKLLSKNNLTDKDYNDLIDIFDDNFSEWFRFVNGMSDSSKELNMIRDNSRSYNSKLVLAELKKEFSEYEKDKKKYIKNVLVEKKNHKLFLIQPFIQDNKIKNKQFANDVSHRYRPFFKEIAKVNSKLNKRNCKGAFRGPFHKIKLFFKKPSIKNLKEVGKSVLLARNVFRDRDLFDRISDNYDAFKNAPSVKTHIDHYISWEKERVKEKPSFACIHVDDIHNPEVFFTYDSEDARLIETEIDDAKDVLEHLSKDYYGNITHDMSLRYIDSKIKYFYQQLKKNDLYKDTIVLICADHGFSFSGNPLRDSFVINMYLENYNIPCIVTGAGLSGFSDKLCSSKDIPSILSYLADGHVSDDFNGKNVLLDENKYEECFIEYCGGGCPDLERRELKIACFDENYLVATESTLKKKLNLQDITEAYDLKNDYLQINNLAGNNAYCEVFQSYINRINKRKEKIIDTNTVGMVEK